MQFTYQSVSCMRYRRYISNDTLFNVLTKTSLSLPETKSFLGGNAPVMARRMANEGAEVLLAARFTKELRETLPKSVRGITDCSIFFKNHY